MPDNNPNEEKLKKDLEKLRSLESQIAEIRKNIEDYFEWNEDEAQRVVQRMIIAEEAPENED